MALLRNLGSYGTKARGMDYLAPNVDDRDDKKLAWVNHVTESGRQYLQNQHAQKHIRGARDAVMGVVREKVPKSLSRLQLNRPKRQIQEVVSVLSNLRTRFEYKTDNKNYYNQAQLLNDLAKSWWLQTFADRKLKEGLQYAATDGIGYIGLSWDKAHWTNSRGEIVPRVYSSESVLPYQIGEDHDLQKAYAVTIINRVPIIHAQHLFPKHAKDIKPDRGDSSGGAGGAGMGSALSKFSSPVLKMFAGGGTKQSPSEPWPMVTLRYTYVLDNTVNHGSRPKKMGPPGASWGYTVPQVGGNVPDGYNPDGTVRYREANDHDAKLFPMRRLIISTENVILYDGSNVNWHGKVPVTPLWFDKWPWEYLPFSLVSEVMGINASNMTLMRAIDDSMKARLRPPMMYDNRVLSENAVRKMDPRKEGQTIGIDFSLGDQPIKPYLPQEFYNVPPHITEHIKEQEHRSDYQIGIQDFNALAKAKQIPSGDTMEALMQAIGPLVQDMTRGMEHSVRDIGEQW
ncbi:MAG: portal protein, partial [Candidatus Thorarchaeota archaeon]